MGSTWDKGGAIHTVVEEVEVVVGVVEVEVLVEVVDVVLVVSKTRDVS